MVAGLYEYISKGKLQYSSNALNNFLFFLGLYVLIIILLSTVISCARIIYKINEKVNQIELNPDGKKTFQSKIIKKKKLPYKFELETINYNFIEYTALIKRRWLPTEEKPGIEEFIDAIEFSKERCGKCHSDFYINHGVYSWYSCKNPDCENNKKMMDTEIQQTKRLAFSKYKGDVRTNYSKYWEMYKNIYDRYTKKNYSEYEDPF